jgi:integrase/recombinase XerD
MKSTNAGEKHINNNLKIIMSFTNTLEQDIDLESVKRAHVINFLDSKIKSPGEDPDKKWITTWNVYLNHLKYFFRWLYNEYNKNRDESIESEYISQINWITPDFIKIQRKRTKRLSPYIESELWEKEDLLLIIKYEKFKRNKASLSLLWDLDARNHKVTLLKIEHIRLKEKYEEGAIPYEVKTGKGPRDKL